MQDVPSQNTTIDSADVKSWQAETDVLIVGGGGAGDQCRHRGSGCGRQGHRTGSRE